MKPILIIEVPSGTITEETQHLMRQSLMRYVEDYYCIIIDGESDQFRYFISSQESLNKEEFKQLNNIYNDIGEIV